MATKNNPYNWRNRVKRTRAAETTNDLIIIDTKVFDFKGTNTTVIVDAEGNPWWIGPEVCKILEYDGQYDKAVKRHCKYPKLLKPYDSHNLGLSPRGCYVIKESDLYRLIMGSNMAQAVEFQDWVCEEVLPEIRKTGSYGNPKIDRHKMANAITRAEMAQMILDAEEEREQFAQNAQEEKARADKAVREKGWISERREAQACARASAEVRRSNKLLDELGMGPKWKTVRATHWIAEYFKGDLATLSQVGKTLVRISKQMGKDVREAHDPLFNYVNTYHITVLNKFRQLLDDDPEFMKVHRRDIEEAD